MTRRERLEKERFLLQAVRRKGCFFNDETIAIDESIDRIDRLLAMSDAQVEYAIPELRWMATAHRDMRNGLHPEERAAVFEAIVEALS